MHTNIWASQVSLVVKNLPVSAGDIRDVGSIPGSARSLGGGHGNPLQCSCLKNRMDRGAWQATILTVAENQTPLKWLSMNTHLHINTYIFLYICIQFSSVGRSCLTLCDPMDCSMPGFPVHCQLPDAIQPSHPLLSPSPPSFNLSQHQGLFK